MDQANSDVKAVLYAFLGKRKLTPDYSLRPTGSLASDHRQLHLCYQNTALFCPTGPKHHQRFFCEVRVQGEVHNSICY